MSVYKKLIDVQNKLKAPKSQYNNFGKYNYRNAEDILEALKPVLNDVGATVFIRDEILLIGDRFYVKAIATFVDIDSGISVEASALARESEEKKGMDSAQVTGATSSYARKYALNGLFLIDDTKDNDHDSNYQTDIKKAELEKNKQENNLKEYNKKMDACIKYLTEFVGNDVEKFEKVISHMNKTFGSNHKGFNTFKLEELENYIEALKKKGGK